LVIPFLLGSALLFGSSIPFGLFLDYLLLRTGFSAIFFAGSTQNVQFLLYTTKGKYIVKKVSGFPVPSWDVTYKTLREKSGQIHIV
jgi:hypothetical protein